MDNQKPDDQPQLDPTPAAVAAAKAAADALPIADAATPGIPIAVYVHQGTVLAGLAKRDRQTLIDVGCDLGCLDTLDARIVHLRNADADWQVRRAGKGDTQAELEKRAVGLRDATLADARWFLRHEPDIRANLRDIAEGDGLADALADLDALALLLEVHGGKIKPTPKLDPARRAEECRRAASAARQGAVAWKIDDSNDALKVARDKAFAYADAAVSEVREAGRYAFRGDDKKLAEYRDAYNAALQRRYRKARAAEAAEQAAKSGV